VHSSSRQKPARGRNPHPWRRIFPAATTTAGSRRLVRQRSKVGKKAGRFRGKRTANGPLSLVTEPKRHDRTTIRWQPRSPNWAFGLAPPRQIDRPTLYDWAVNAKSAKRARLRRGSCAVSIRTMLSEVKPEFIEHVEGRACIQGRSPEMKISANSGARP
jgi:hypothetical protein